MAFPSKINPEAIRAAAIDMLEREGEGALTLRRIASVLGVVPNALYRYFASREALIAVVADEVARRLLAAMNEALDHPDAGPSASAEYRVRVLADVFVKFAAAHPALYQTLMTAMSVDPAGLPHPEWRDRLWMKVVEVLEPLTGSNNAPPAAIALWSLLHGAWSLKRAKSPAGKMSCDADVFAINALLKGLAI